MLVALAQKTAKFQSALIRLSFTTRTHTHTHTHTPQTNIIQLFYTDKYNLQQGLMKENKVLERTQNSQSKWEITPMIRLCGALSYVLISSKRHPIQSNPFNPNCMYQTFTLCHSSHTAVLPKP